VGRVDGDVIPDDASVTRAVLSLEQGLDQEVEQRLRALMACYPLASHNRMVAMPLTTKRTTFR
jgi:hypothetical protein